MRSAVFIQVVIAALAAMPSAYAGIEATTIGPSSASLSDPPGADAVLSAQGMASPTPESAPAAGGAFFSPFAMTPAKPARREPEGAGYLSNGNADLTFSVAASLAAVAAFAYLLRRASR